MRKASEAVGVGETDADVAERVQLLLNSQGAGYRSIRVEVRPAAIRLAGTVATYFLRQMAVTIAGQAAGGRQVEDRLEVVLDGSVANQAR